MYPKRTMTRLIYPHNNRRALDFMPSSNIATLSVGTVHGFPDICIPVSGNYVYLVLSKLEQGTSTAGIPFNQSSRMHPGSETPKHCCDKR